MNVIVLFLTKSPNVCPAIFLRFISGVRNTLEALTLRSTFMIFYLGLLTEGLAEYINHFSFQHFSIIIIFLNCTFVKYFSGSNFKLLLKSVKNLNGLYYWLTGSSWAFMGKRW